MKDKPISSITSRLVQITSPDHYTPWNALSLEALAGHVRGCFGARADVHISRVRSEEDIPLLLDAIKVNPPDILGISPELSSLKWTEMILQRFHKLDFSPASAPLVVLGNKLPSYFPQYYLKQFPGVIVVIGEGEESFAGLIRYAAGERTLESIPNLVYFDNQGNLKYTQQQTPDLSLLPYPPALDTVDEIAENDWNALVQSSRGCSWSSCSYCTISSFRKGKKWDGFPVERVAQNIKQLVAAGITQLEFADDDFIGGRDDTHLNRIEKIADEIEAISKSSGKNIDFRIFVIPHIIYRKNQDDVNEKVKQLLLRLKEVGLSKVYFGVEAGCPSQLKRYNRSYNLHELDAVIHLFREQLEMEIDVGFIMFDPHLTLKEMKQNIEYFIDKKLIFGNQWPFRPLAVNEGSRILEAMKKMQGQNQGPGDLNLALMSYAYTFSNSEIRTIYDYINELSHRSAGIFYTLKQMSKQQFRRKKKTIETQRAEELIIKNGNIFLILMRNLVNCFLEGTPGECGQYVAAALEEIDHLVAECKETIEKGIIISEKVELLKKINLYFEQKPNSRPFASGGNGPGVAG